MCGILLNIFRNRNGKIHSEKFRELICNRGPNSCNEIEDIIGNGWNSLILGSVLWTQGDKTAVQPIRDGNGNFLLWNGDVYHGLSNWSETCDSELVFAELVQHDVLSVISQICGPYAFIYYDAISNTLWFGRDAVGRHSLLWNINLENLLLTSVCPRSAEVEEVPNYGIFKIDLSSPVIEMYFHPWSHLSEDRFKFNVNVGFSICNKLCHASFISPYHYDWYNKEPEPQEIEFLSGFATTAEAATIFQQLALYLPFHNIIQKIKHLMFQSVEKRIKIKPAYCSNCISSLTICNHSKFAILFSGGLDSTILAAIANSVAPQDESIDLYNVAFKRYGIKSDGFLVPDRRNGYESLKELSLLYPQRKWNFVEINVGEEELGELRSRHIADLIYPLKSILDDSLGCALWFAARGKGVLNSQPYISPARIVLLGMGADEIFGGYSRHRKEFEKQLWSGLGLQLIEEVNNIGKRNLGRDNRVVTDHGRQPRLPYLDEKLLEFALSLPPWHRCCLTSNMTAGIGDKILLRSLAWNLGLRYCTILPKKALQFGSKIANPKEKGHELSENLVHCTYIEDKIHH